MMGTYRLVLTPARYFTYTATLFDPEGHRVDANYCDTVWGARLWARRAAKRHANPRPVRPNRLEFVVKA